ncbi:hypothetical protein GE061_002003 [Apolygus lucorum]|uniref:Lysophospholipase NTE1-like P-loop domain-containing protein n=1 Tax=Apolygus lucorum TaxID=248454 RepID=A0A8S9X3E9_APOLU|nr:hypothetical protein GE061_002003 [Apolygus lucorum]
MRFPVVVTRLINLLGHRIIGSWQNPSVGRVDNRPTHNNFTTVAILPVSDDVPLTSFTYELYHCLCAIGPALRLTSEPGHNAVFAKLTAFLLLDSATRNRVLGRLTRNRKAWDSNPERAGSATQRRLRAAIQHVGVAQHATVDNVPPPSPLQPTNVLSTIAFPAERTICQGPYY